MNEVIAILNGKAEHLTKSIDYLRKEIEQFENIQLPSMKADLSRMMESLEQISAAIEKLDN